jgi:hypothetical protein
MRAIAAVQLLENLDLRWRKSARELRRCSRQRLDDEWNVRLRRQVQTEGEREQGREDSEAAG